MYLQTTDEVFHMNTVLLVIAVATVGLLVLLGIVSVCLNFILLDRTNHFSDIQHRLQTMDDSIADINNILNLDMGGGSSSPYRSIDGKYSAASLEELVQKMAQGGDIDIDPNDPELLKKFFEQLTEEQDDDDEEDEKKPWDK
jgi:hypothetical protein